MLLCKKNREIQAIRSNAGYFLGTLNEEGMPECRLSQDYYKTPEEAMASGDYRRQCATENAHCADGSGCGIHEAAQRPSLESILMVFCRENAMPAEQDKL